MSKRQAYLRLLLVGNSGSGKSATGNTILGEKRFKTGFNPTSVTKHLQCERAPMHDKWIEVVDSPDLFDTTKTDEEVTIGAVEALALTHPGPHAILYVVRCDVRYTEEEYNTYLRLKSCLGDEVVKHIIVILTHGDELEMKNISINSFCKNNATAELQSVFAECGKRCIVFNNKLQGQMSNAQVKNLMQMINQFGGQYYDKSPNTPTTAAKMTDQVQINLNKNETYPVQRNGKEKEKEKSTTWWSRKIVAYVLAGVGGVSTIVLFPFSVGASAVVGAVSIGVFVYGYRQEEKVKRED